MNSSSGTSEPLADSVRLALAGEAEAIADIQRRAWLDELPSEAVDQLLAGLDGPQMAEAWRTAIRRPPQARYRVLVAVTAERVVGFAATVPSPDPDADPALDGLIDEFVIDPPARRRGHGSRLLNACVDTLRADGFNRATYWVATGNDVLRAFLTDAGWAPDGGFREIGTEDASVRIKQVRLHSDITEP